MRLRAVNEGSERVPVRPFAREDIRHILDDLEIGLPLDSHHFVPVGLLVSLVYQTIDFRVVVPENVTNSRRIGHVRAKEHR